MKNDATYDVSRLKKIKIDLKTSLSRCFLNGIIFAGQLFGSRSDKFGHYQRTFDNVTAAPDTHAYLRPQEHEDENESALFKEISNLFAADTTSNSDIPAGSGKKAFDRNEVFNDPHWGSTTGLLQGTLTIDDLESIPEPLRAGLFKKTGSYQVVCRPNFLFDDTPVIAISRLSLKIRYDSAVPNVYTSEAVNEIDLLLSEGIRLQQHGQQDGQGFFFRDVRQMMFVFNLKKSKAAALAMLFNRVGGKIYKNWSRLFSKATDGLYTNDQLKRGWAGKHYFSAGPYALGDGAMKFSLAPCQAHPVELIQPKYQYSGHLHRQSLLDLATRGQPIEFDLCIQIATKDSIPDRQEGDPPPAVMAAEYTDIVWDETHAPFERVGRLTLEPRELSTEALTNAWFLPADDRWHSADEVRPYAIRFNAWNTFKDTRPLGQLFRARKYAHVKHREARLSHSFDAKPKADSQCPFSTK